VIPYTAQFPRGTRVRIVSREDLEDFRESWRFHNPLSSEQLRYAAREATVKEVGFYHGGDVIYELVDIPGVWHEACLSSSRDHDV
jgi:hypothetical protein